jgi:2-polyprenyl-3-methyl-5-hydroxy-6-metoxy-1,4-benzoquinol methylase
VSGEIFQIQKCGACGFLFTNPRPAESDIGKYYQSANYVSHSDEKKGFMYRLYGAVRKINNRTKLRIINERFPSKGKLLDVGCGIADFLNECKNDGWDITGIDSSEAVIKKSFEKHGIKVETEEHLAGIPDKSVQVITMWHVLEHVHKLNERIQELKRIVTDDGLMFIALPNSSSPDALHYKEKWDGFDVPRHLYHFHPEAVEKLMKNHGLSVIEKKKMKFDAYYISMRSEDHSGNPLYFISGMFNGLISDIKASSKKNYSSLLYIVKKDL